MKKEFVTEIEICDLDKMLLSWISEGVLPELNEREKDLLQGFLGEGFPFF